MIRITPQPAAARPAAPSSCNVNVESFCSSAIRSIRAIPLAPLSAQKIRKMAIAIRRLELRLRVIQFFNAPENRHVTEDEIKGRAKHIYATFSGQEYRNPEKVFDDYQHARAAADPARDPALARKIITMIRREIAFYTAEKAVQPLAPAPLLKVAPAPLPPPATLPPPAFPILPLPPHPPLQKPLSSPVPKARSLPPITADQQARLNRAAQRIVLELEKKGLKKRITVELQISAVAVGKIRDGKYAVTSAVLEELKLIAAKTKPEKSQLASPITPPRRPLASSLPSATSVMIPTSGSKARQLFRELGRAGMDEFAVSRKTGLSIPLLGKIRRGEVEASPEILEKLRAVKA